MSLLIALTFEYACQAVVEMTNVAMNKPLPQIDNCIAAITVHFISEFDQESVLNVFNVVL